MNEAEERKLYEDWLHQSPEFAETIISAWDVWLGRAALSAPAVPEGWIPVSEQLPDAGQQVLMYITHWMPHPAAPEQPEQAAPSLTTTEPELNNQLDNLAACVMCGQLVEVAPQPQEQRT